MQITRPRVAELERGMKLSVVDIEKDGDRLYMQLNDKINEWISRNPIVIWRKQNNLPRRYVAAIMGVGDGTVKSWENGNFAPATENMAKLAQLLDNPDFSKVYWEWEDTRPWVTQNYKPVVYPKFNAELSKMLDEERAK